MEILVKRTNCSNEEQIFLIDFENGKLHSYNSSDLKIETTTFSQQAQIKLFTVLLKPLNCLIFIWVNKQDKKIIINLEFPDKYNSYSVRNERRNNNNNNNNNHKSVQQHHSNHHHHNKIKHKNQHNSRATSALCDFNFKDLINNSVAMPVAQSINLINKKYKINDKCTNENYLFMKYDTEESFNANSYDYTTTTTNTINPNRVKYMNNRLCKFENIINFLEGLKETSTINNDKDNDYVIGNQQKPLKNQIQKSISDYGDDYYKDYEEIAFKNNELYLDTRVVNENAKYQLNNVANATILTNIRMVSNSATILSISSSNSDIKNMANHVIIGYNYIEFLNRFILLSISFLFSNIFLL